MDNTEYDEEVRALAEHLSVEPDEIEETSWDSYRFAGQEWLVYDEEGAAAAAHERIVADLWAFNAEFLWRFTPEGVEVDHLKKIGDALYEDAQPVFLALVQAGSDVDDLVRGAIAEDGRGHFLSGYDSNEVEMPLNLADGTVVTYFGYRQ
jgi:hypothetical protein